MQADVRRQIREVLSEILHQYGDIMLVVSDAGLHPGALPMNGTADQLWHAVLEEAAAQGPVATRRLLATAARAAPVILSRLPPEVIFDTSDLTHPHGAGRAPGAGPAAPAQPAAGSPAGREDPRSGAAPPSSLGPPAALGLGAAAGQAIAHGGGGAPEHPVGLDAKAALEGLFDLDRLSPKAASIPLAGAGAAGPRGEIVYLGDVFAALGAARPPLDQLARDLGVDDEVVLAWVHAYPTRALTLIQLFLLDSDDVGRLAQVTQRRLPPLARTLPREELKSSEERTAYNRLVREVWALRCQVGCATLAPRAATFSPAWCDELFETLLEIDQRVIEATPDSLGAAKRLLVQVAESLDEVDWIGAQLEQLSAKVGALKEMAVSLEGSYCSYDIDAPKQLADRLALGVEKMEDEERQLRALLTRPEATSLSSLRVHIEGMQRLLLEANQEVSVELEMALDAARRTATHTAILTTRLYNEQVSFTRSELTVTFWVGTLVFAGSILFLSGLELNRQHGPIPAVAICVGLGIVIVGMLQWGMHRLIEGLYDKPERVEAAAEILRRVVSEAELLVEFEALLLSGAPEAGQGLVRSEVDQLRREAEQRLDFEVRY